MRARRSGTLLFVGSVSVYYSSLGASCYIGSKSLLDGLVPNLALEAAEFGLRTSILTVGHFRTDVLGPQNVQYQLPNPVPEYAEIRKQIEETCSMGSAQFPGDPKKACELVVEAVRGEGRCAGKELPLRLPVGSDTFGIMRSNCQERLKACDEWEGIMSDTNVD